MDELQKPNTNRETKDTEPEILQKSKRYYPILIQSTLYEDCKITSKKKKNHPNIETKTKAKQKQIITKIPLSKTYLSKCLYIYIVSVLFH